MTRSKRRSKYGKRSKRRSYRATATPIGRRQQETRLQPPEHVAPQLIMGDVINVPEELKEKLRDEKNNEDENSLLINFLGTDMNAAQKLKNHLIINWIRSMRNTLRRILLNAAQNDFLVSDTNETTNALMEVLSGTVQTLADNTPGSYISDPGPPPEITAPQPPS